ncbi:hypothetical protein DPMN_167601 [Dreissena polymorpha]|uniref:Uncharacterized protein n=1 Tax=Dreissena polymorpha TaxID=45954 RepID=A0A9D4F4T9_DREPO|nr:hypothetical protein DPMN_167601 [Dreissena polymorpha]
MNDDGRGVRANLGNFLPCNNGLKNPRFFLDAFGCVAENALGEKHSRFHAYFYSCYTYAASVYQAMGDNWRLIMARGSTHNPKKLGFSENLGSLKT